MKILESILLVDDSPSTNFYHKKVIEKNIDGIQIYQAENGKEALDFLTSSTKEKKPNLIFLDINMPVMDGFQFLDHYSKLEKKDQVDVIVVFLTTSNWIKDKTKALNSELVYDFIEKPLTKEHLNRIINHFNDVVESIS